MNTKHTPAPWRMDETQGEGDCIYISADLEGNQKKPWDNPVICQLYEAKGEPYDYQTIDTAFANSKANARLIAAAPELLEALKTVYAHWGLMLPEDVSLKMHKAIAKAEGRE